MQSMQASILTLSYIHTSVQVCKPPRFPERGCALTLMVGKTRDHQYITLVRNQHVMARHVMNSDGQVIIIILVEKCVAWWWAI